MKKCTTCGRIFASNVKKKFTCPNCHQPIRVDGKEPEQTHGSLRSKHFRIGSTACLQCENYSPSEQKACRVLECNSCSLNKHIVSGKGCPVGKFPSMPCHVDPVVPKSITDVQLVTVHFNPTRAKRLADTFYEWRDSLGKLTERLVCYELVFDDHAPEIEDSVVLRAESAKSLMWQKEALLNRALRDCTSNYFAWLDHDICIQSPTWLVDAIEMLDGGKKAVQLFATLAYLTKEYKEIRTATGRVAYGHGAPGGAWIASTDYLRSLGGFYSQGVVGGGDEHFLCAVTAGDYVTPGGYGYWFYPYSVVGSGDEWFYAAVTGNAEHTERHVSKRLSDSLRDEVRKYIANGNGKPENVGYIDSHAYHLWHGDRENRQYQTRELILQRHQFDPRADIRIRSDGALEWATNKTQMHAEVRQFFEDRRDDG